MDRISKHNAIKPVLVMLIPRGEAIRNFIYSGVADGLRADYQLVFFSVIPNKAIEELLRSNCDVFYELEATPKLSYASRLLIDQTDLAHNRYLWSEAAKLRWKLRDVEARGLRTKISSEGNAQLNSERYISGPKALVQIKIKKMIARVTAFSRGLQFFDGMLARLATREPEVLRLKEVLKKINPVLVLNTSHIHALNTYPIMQAAVLSGIKTAAFLFSWDNLTSQGRIFPQSNYYLSWNGSIKQQLLKIYPNIKPAQVVIAGTPQFLFHFNKTIHVPRHDFLESIGLLPNQKYVLYSVGLSHNIPFEEVVCERIADMLPKIDPDLKLVVRTYSKDRTTAYESLAQRRPDICIPKVTWIPNFQTPTEDDQVRFTNLLLHCSLGINVGSTVSLELAMFNKPVIYVGYDPPGKQISPISYKQILNYDHLRPIVSSGAFAYANTEAEMFQWIEKYYFDSSIHEDERESLIRNFFEVDDLNGENMLTSASSIVNAILTVAAAPISPIKPL